MTLSESERDITIHRARQEDLAGAVEVWRAANTARGMSPSPERESRVRQKLAAVDACVVVGRYDNELVAMALAEPGRSADGEGAIQLGYGHVSMVFVSPDMWGRRIGGELVDGLHDILAQRGWERTTLWTRISNQRAMRLYESHGYRRTGYEKRLNGADMIAQLERRGGLFT